jgi:hypothetical protein
MARHTLEEYFRSQTHVVNGVTYPVIDHALRCEFFDGGVRFYIHPASVSGDTQDFELHGNALTPNMLVTYPDDDATE